MLAGLTASYLWGLKPGGTIVLTQVAILIVLVVERGIQMGKQSRGKRSTD